MMGLVNGEKTLRIFITV